MSRHRCRTGRPAQAMAFVVALLCMWLPATPAGAAAAHLIRISRQPPPCTNPSGMPIVPNDPGALVTPGGRRCYGAGPAELELWLREDHYVWLQPHASEPAAWIELEPAVVEPHALQPPPLGLRLSASDGNWVLEARYGDTATLTHLDANGWHAVTSPDGQRFWVRMDGDEPVRRAVSGRVRLRAD